MMESIYRYAELPKYKVLMYHQLTEKFLERTAPLEAVPSWHTASLGARGAPVRQFSSKANTKNKQMQLYLFTMVRTIFFYLFLCVVWLKCKKSPHMLSLSKISGSFIAAGKFLPCLMLQKLGKGLNLGVEKLLKI